MCDHPSLAERFLGGCGVERPAYGFGLGDDSLDWPLCAEAGENPDGSLRACTDIINANVETQQNLAIAHYNRGNAHSTKQDNDRALADFDTAIELNPDLGPAYNNRALIYDAKGDYDRAIADFDKARTYA